MTPACHQSTQTPTSSPLRTWFRGQLHMHTFLSDGRAFAEQALECYRRNGYHFASISDHNRFGSDDPVWKKIETDEGGWPPNVSHAACNALIRETGVPPEQRLHNNDLFVRLKTFRELEKQFNVNGRFLMIPGVEVTDLQGDRNLHMNYHNVPDLLPSIREAEIVRSFSSPSSISERICEIAEELSHTAAPETPYLLTLNHPFWRFQDVLPQDVIDNPSIRFFEICNGGADFPLPPLWHDWGYDRFWDVVNAYRATHGQPLLYGIASDDAHFYDDARKDLRGAPNFGWIMVQAGELTIPALLTAMHQGHFYASTGVTLEEICFCERTGTLRIRVRPERGINYRIRFITTRRGYPDKPYWQTLPSEGKRPERTIPVYSNEIGRTTATVDGLLGEYRLDSKDLYVRARIESDQPSRLTLPPYPLIQTAWTQPYIAGKTGL